MSERLQALVAERDTLEAAGDFESGAYMWLVERVAELEAEAPATPVPAPEAEPATPAERLAQLERDLRDAALHPERVSDEQRGALIERLNGEVRSAAGEASPEPETVDVAELERQMVDAAGRGTTLDPAESGPLVERFNRAVQHQVTHVTPAGELEGLLAGDDLAGRYSAAAELARRGLLEDGMAEQMVERVNGMVREAAAAGPLDPERVPEGPVRDLAGRLRDQVAEDEAALHPQLDERGQLVDAVNRLVREAGEQARERVPAPAGAPTTEPTEGSPAQEA